MPQFFPEGILIKTEENAQILKGVSGLKDAIANETVLEARAVVCDSAHNLIVDLGPCKGIIPREEGALGIAEGTTRDIAVISRVNKPVCFIPLRLEDRAGGTVAVLSRKRAQQKCYAEYVAKLTPGDVIPAVVTHLEPFGCFVDVGCGIASLIPIDAISVSRISHPRDRFTVGQQIFAVVRSICDDGKICLSHKELLGTWEENAAGFHPGETVAGVIRSVESYGIFVELTPNLAGLAELKEDALVGQSAGVYIKSLIPEKMKVKLIIVDSFSGKTPPGENRYFITSGHLKRWKYSPDDSGKVIETVFEEP